MKIQVTNRTTTVGPDEFLTGCAGVFAQVRGEFSAAWDIIPPDLQALVPGQPEDPSSWQMDVAPTSDVPGAGGYHDNDGRGRPRGHAFLDSGMIWTKVLSHELMEMVKDPFCTLWSMTPDGRLRAFEMCDAVEADDYDKTVGDSIVKVSNFLLPPYFSAVRTGLQTDYLNRLSGDIAPARTPGGYDLVVDSSGQPSQELSAHLAMLTDGARAQKHNPGSRTMIRLANARDLLLPGVRT